MRRWKRLLALIILVLTGLNLGMRSISKRQKRAQINRALDEIGMSPRAKVSLLLNENCSLATMVEPGSIDCPMSECSVRVGKPDSFLFWGDHVYLTASPHFNFPTVDKFPTSLYALVNLESQVKDSQFWQENMSIPVLLSDLLFAGRDYPFQKYKGNLVEGTLWKGDKEPPRVLETTLVDSPVVVYWGDNPLSFKKKEDAIAVFVRSSCYFTPLTDIVEALVASPLTVHVYGSCDYGVESYRVKDRYPHCEVLAATCGSSQGADLKIGS